MNEYKYTGDVPDGVPSGARNRIPIYTKGGIQVATGFSRVVHGGRGAYVEFRPDHIINENMSIPPLQAWRLLPTKENPAYYEEYRTKDGIKVYHQRRTVDYADYVVGKWYISPRDLVGFEIVGKYD